MGTDTLPTLQAAKHYYGDENGGFSVPATEHSVMCSHGKAGEIETIRYLMNKFPTGILSVVSDTWDLWNLITVYLPQLKEEILTRDGKLVIRPDSGDPVDIICGVSTKYEDLSKYFPDGEILPEYFEDSLLEEVREDTPHGECGVSEHENIYIVRGKLYKAKIHNISWNRYDKQYYFIEMWDKAKITVEELQFKPSDKGVVELLWDIFGGTVNEQGYKVLDPHIGAIYGDSITPERAVAIAERLKAKGFANQVVLGIGSYSLGYATRDSQGGAVKSTYVEVNGEGRDIFKDPITDDGTKKSAKGLLQVYEVKGFNTHTDKLEHNTYKLKDQCTWEEEGQGLLTPVFKDGQFLKTTTLTQIREKLWTSI
jgi:nicotinamide phosphoribosyltransferase